jgi:acyl transferase domain-containing protein/acyl carrier protein
MSGDRGDFIAIVGLAGRFPDAADVAAFWRNLEQGLESIVSFTDEELRASGITQRQIDSPAWVKKGTILDGAEMFDAPFFGFTHREAQIMDPQHRIFLECAWEAMEDAGYGAETQPGRVGVFAGCSMNSHMLANLARNRAFLETAGAYQLMLGNDKDFLTTRVSYKLNLKGPSLAVQSACSTSLVAVHAACQSLLRGECEMALAGGVSVRFPQKTGHPYVEGMILSPDGHCRPFDAQAGGIRGGMGAGLVVLRRLDEALRDGDAIRAVIRGIAVNNDGAAKIGYTAPSVEGQAAAISAALEMGGVDAATVGYIEAHGAATILGDPIEIAALDRVYRRYTERKQFCAIGSVKSNIGHLDAAAGVAGLIKVILALERKRIPASLNFRAPNPQIDFENSPFYVNDSLSEWKNGTGPRRAAVSSFGIGGTNAHAVLEEAPAREQSLVNWPAHVLLLSAKSAPALESATARMARHLEDNPSLPIADICYTTQVGRRRFPHRRALLCAGREDAIAALLERRPAVFEEDGRRPVAFLFSGQGSQHAGMARDLYRIQPAFRLALDRCAEILQPEIGCDLRALIYEEPAGDALLQETRFAQPALFAIEYALAQMWISWSIKPAGMIGHSIGEYAAATLAGVFSLEDALRLVAARGRIMQCMPPGEMLAVHAPERDVAALAGRHISIAAVNAPSLCTVSGPSERIELFRHELTAQGIQSQALHTSHAFHSEMMDDALEPFRRCVRGVRLSEPGIPFVSNASGAWIQPEQATDPEYWVRHLRQTVRFADGLSQLAAPGRILLEVGPGQALCAFAREAAKGVERCEVLPSLPHPKDPHPASSCVLQTAARLWMSGAPIDWAAVHEGERLHRVPLPTYPFERRLYSVDPDEAAVAAPAVHNEPLAKRGDISDWFYTPAWTLTPLPSAVATGEGGGPWLILDADSGAGDLASQLLRERNQACVVSDAGRDFLSLLGDLSSRGLAPRSILFLHGLKSGRRGFDSLLLLAQALGEMALSASIDLVIVSAGMHSVTGREQVDPEQALLSGPAKVMPREFANIRCRSVDIAPGGLSRETLEQILLEPGMPDASRPVAYRDGRRWQQCASPVRLPKAAKLPVRERGVYLITGGTGGIGLTLAAHLAETARARLVLTSRRAPGPDALERLERAGAEVLHVCADVCDRGAMERALSEARRRFGAIDGVIHAAGVAGAGLMQLKTPEAAARVLGPKVEGTLILDSLLGSEPLDFFVLCSSINSLCGVAGAVDYTSANAFLDSFAASRQKGGRASVLSIDWDAWQEVGMAVNTAVPEEMQQARRDALEATGITPSEGIEAFRRALASGLPQVAVITRDLHRLLEEAERRQPAPAADAVPAPDVEPRSGGDGSETETQAVVRSIWKELLGGDVGLDDNFFELGGHSLVATGVLSRIGARFGIHIPLRAIFEAPTVRTLSERVETLLWVVGRSAPEIESEEREEVEI